MSKKIQDYVKRLKKFLEENYITYPLKMLKLKKIILLLKLKTQGL